MNVVTASQMAEIDSLSPGKGVSHKTLMENAGLAVTRKALELLPQGKRDITILTGAGNNGGDGYVAARFLRLFGCRVHIFSLFPVSKLKGLALEMYHHAADRGVDVRELLDIRSLSELKNNLTECGLVIDAVFGTGLSKTVTGHIAEALKLTNASQCIKLAVDVPSGLNADSGCVMGAGFCADWTVTLGLPKKGFFTADGPAQCGRVEVADIGFSPELLEQHRSDIVYTRKESLPWHLLQKPTSAHKGTFGHVLVIGGSERLLGAPMLSAQAASSVGAGLVTAAIPESLNAAFKESCSDQMTLPLNEKNGALACAKANLRKLADFPCSAVVFGPGLTVTKETRQLTREYLSACTVPCVIDADGLNCLAKNPAVLKTLAGRCVITPHAKEMARLTGWKIDKVLLERYTSSSFCAKTYGVTSILKGAYTLIGDKDTVYVNPHAVPVLAAGGTGDILAGIIGAFLARGIAPIGAARLGVFIHGEMGLEAEKTAPALPPSDLLRLLPSVLQRLVNSP